MTYENFQDWKDFLSERVEQAHELGIDDKTISNIAYQIGDYLAEKIEPSNAENRLLKELWESSNENQQKVLAEIMINYVEKH